jgi:hypothetical protein
MGNGITKFDMVADKKKKKLYGEGVVSNQNDEGYFG